MHRAQLMSPAVLWPTVPLYRWCCASYATLTIARSLSGYAPKRKVNTALQCAVLTASHIRVLSASLPTALLSTIDSCALSSYAQSLVPQAGAALLQLRLTRREGLTNCDAIATAVGAAGLAK